MEFSKCQRLLTSVIIFVICLQQFWQTCSSQNLTTCQLGECTDFRSCPILRPAISIKSSSKEVIDIIKQHRCGNNQSISLCCADIEADLARNNILANVTLTGGNNTFGLVHLMTTPCGLSEPDRILGNGVNAVLFEFPWMALLEFNTSQGMEFLCGGSLISDRYVLTAAHCFISPNTQLLSVRLGEYDISKEIDCDSPEDCALPIERHEVEDVIIHSDFKKGAFGNDIALIRLKAKAVFRDGVLPICLPISKDLIRNIDSATVAGWGYTVSGRPSDKLQKMHLPVLSNEYCGNLFGRNFSSAYVCAGGRRGEDTCKGDSGGPLFARTGSYLPKFVQYGILSGGGIVCGGENTVPSIYTSVRSFVPWIIKNIKA